MPEGKNTLRNVSFLVCVLFLLSDKLPAILGLIKVNAVRCKSNRRGSSVMRVIFLLESQGQFYLDLLTLTEGLAVR